MGALLLNHARKNWEKNNLRTVEELEDMSDLLAIKIADMYEAFLCEKFPVLPEIEPMTAQEYDEDEDSNANEEIYRVMKKPGNSSPRALIICRLTVSCYDFFKTGIQTSYFIFTGSSFR